MSGNAGPVKIEIKELWYRRFPLGGTTRKLARDEMEINHIGSLRLRDERRKHATAAVVFHLSPIEYFKRHTASTMILYSSTPKQTAELFKIHATGLGEITFLKQWVFHHENSDTTSAIVHAGYYAEVACQQEDLRNIDDMVDTFREVLTVLAILFRQAISLLAWETRCNNGTETLWKEPLQPNLAPYMGLEPGSFLAYPKEFQNCAQSLVTNHLSIDKRLREVIKHLSVSIAPHVTVPARTRYLSMFAALEQVIGTVKLPISQKQKLAASNTQLVGHLRQVRTAIEKDSSEFTNMLIARVDGFINLVESSRPSFAVKLAAALLEYPALAMYLVDLWPIEGSGSNPGLKEIRNKITHSAHDKVDAQAIAVASWHFSLLIERLIFVMVGAEVPKGICHDSYLLARDEWYGQDYWRDIQKSALKA